MKGEALAILTAKEAKIMFLVDNKLIFKIIFIILPLQVPPFMYCTTCYEVILHACPDSIILKAGLTPTTEYYWLIETRHGKIYQRKSITDAEGVLTMDVSLLPAGMLNSSAGFFKLQVRQGENYLEVVTLTIGSQEYTCVQMKFQDTEGDAGVNNHIYTEADA